MQTSLTHQHSFRAYNLLILGIILAACFVRVKWYGDPRLSIATNDTESYVKSSSASFFSREMWTGRRLFSTNLIYKLFEPQTGYEIRVNGSLDTTRRALQPGFESMTIFQLIVSLAGWSMFAFAVAYRLQHLWTKLAAIVFILCFAYTPQIADWDSILMSESLTFSLFMMQFAILIHLAFTVYKSPETNVAALVVLWSIVFFFWVFLRDTNLFTALILMAMTGGLLFFRTYRKNKLIIALIFFLGAIFVIGMITVSQSTRSVVQISNVYNVDLLPNPARVETLKQYGMPEPNTPKYTKWFNKNASKTLLKFMFTHPGYVAAKLMDDFPHTFTEIKQNYFKAPELEPTRIRLFHFGDALHPENTTPFVASLLLLTGIIAAAMKSDNESRVWAWLSALLFLIASFTLIPTILGDTWAINRHALFSTMIYRLGIWLYAIILIDLLLKNSDNGESLFEKSR